MKELFPGTAVRDDFQRWLNVGYGPFTIWQGEKALVTISSLEKAPSVNYLYRISPAQDNSLLFCGVYDTEHGSLYLTKDSLSAFTGGEFPPVSGVGPSVADEIGSRISQLVEDKDDIHCLMIGASGVGKTAFFLYPNLEYACASGMSFLALDTKGGATRS